jgi:hypothetical protein
MEWNQYKQNPDSNHVHSIRCSLFILKAVNAYNKVAI